MLGFLVFLANTSFEFFAVPSLVLITFLIAELYKWLVSDKDGVVKSEKAMQFIPILCGITGLILSVIAFYLIPNYLDTSDVFTAAAIGITSGFAATGVDQVFKQINK